MGNLTPMMAQYKKVKAQHSDAILMYRLGDFYEMFFEDALEASKILQITLTARNKGGSEKAPMCGIPYHAVDNYIAKLTRAGKKVAICDQVTEPNGKGIVEREVVRVITPGTTFDDNILDGKSNNYVGAVVSGDSKFAFSYCDITTGEFKVSEFDNVKQLEEEISRVNPAEMIYNDDDGFEALFLRLNDVVKFQYEYFGEAESDLKKHFEIKALKVFGLEEKSVAVEVSGMLFSYLKETQKTNLKHIRKIAYYELGEFMNLDFSCIRNLELFYNNREGKKEGSLAWVLDQTMTSMGGRLLKKWLLHPLIDKKQIVERQKKVEAFVKDSGLMRNVREELKGVLDIERLISRLSLGTGNARDLNGLKQSLRVIPSLKGLVGKIKIFKKIDADLNPLEKLAELIEKAIKDEAPISIKDGGIIKDGYNSELDELRGIGNEGKEFIKQMQEREIKRTGVSSLKVKFNKVFGYYIEISKSNLRNVPDDYIRKQTLVNAERFITPELKEYEEKVLSAEDKIKSLEYELFYEIRMAVVKEIVALQKLASAVAELDVVSNLAFVAERNDYCCPEISDNGEMEIKEGRHPVIEQLSFSREFVPNDCKIGSDRNFLLITGPNMGGKSTYLRQTALISLMAQIGSFVPAESAKLSVLDRIFTRVGASDSLIHGESTFMVEMQEASFILNNATERSLIILDEVGRGTSTYDGVSIAWAIMEFIHDNVKAKTLFATHYHELTELADRLKRAANLSVSVRESEKDGVTFLYKVVDGGVDKSYGIEVAKLAGLDRDIVGRARGVLHELENRHIQRGKVHKDQIDMFGEKREHKGVSDKEKNALDELKKVDVNKMTPIEAMQALNDIKKNFK